MRDYLALGPTPYDEECAQVGSDDYRVLSRAECLRYATGLAARHPFAEFGVKSFPHDFGSYLEVVVYFDSENPESVKAAFEAEEASYATWEDLEQDPRSSTPLHDALSARGIL